MAFSWLTTCSISSSYIAFFGNFRGKLPSSSARAAWGGCTAGASLGRSGSVAAVAASRRFGGLYELPSRLLFSSVPFVLWPFARPCFHSASVATMASADSLAPLGIKGLLGSVSRLSSHAAEFYLTHLDDLWASLFLASLPPAPGLTTRSCSCGQEFASGSFSLRFTARPNLPLRLASSPPSGSFHPDSHLTCQAH